jgi:hypothetical protein
VVKGIGPLNFAVLQEKVGLEVLIDVEIEEQSRFKLLEEVIVFYWSSEELINLYFQNFCTPTSLL